MVRASNAGKTLDRAWSSEERDCRAPVVPEVGQERGVASPERRAQKRPRRHRVFRQKTSLVQRRAQLERLGVDIRVAEALVDAGQRRAHALARGGDDLPIPQVQTADHERSAAGDLVEPPFRLEPDAAVRHDSPDMEGFGECAAEILPHVGRELPALRRRHLGEGQRQIAQRALVAIEMRRDPSPPEPRGARSGFQRERASRLLGQQESRVFQPVTQRL